MVNEANINRIRSEMYLFDNKQPSIQTNKTNKMGYIPPHSALDPAFWTTQNIFVASATILVTLILLIIRYPQDLIGTSRRSKNVIALPNALPLLGDTLLALKISFKQKKLLDEILYHQLRIGKGGKPVSISFPSLGNRQYILNMPQYVHYCQKTEFETFAKGDNFHRRLSDLLGEHGIFVVDGEPWKRQRKMASHIFSVGNFRTCVQQTIDSDLLKMEKLLTNVAKEKVSINLPDLFFRFTLSSFSQLAFSADVECLPETVEGLSIRNSFADAFDFAQLVADERFVAIFPLWLEHFTPTGFKMRKALKTLQTYCYRTIDLRLSARARGENQGAVDSKNGKDLLELFMDMGLSRKELLPIVLNFLIAGRDTTAQSLSWFFLEMATHSEIIEKIREEIQDSFGDRLNESHLTYDDMKQLPYLHAAFYEAIRLHPAVPKNIKQATQDTIIRPYATNDIDAKRDLPGGGTTERLPDITIKKGESVIWSDYVMARMPEIWGKDCEEYKPERFLETRDGKTSVRQFPQAIFHAFNGGPRVCLGQTLATYEGMAVIIAILTNFDIIYDYEKLKSDQPTFAESLTHPIQNPYSVRIQRRNHH